MVEILGWLGAFGFSVCAIPQAYKSYKQKHSAGISGMFLFLWLLGEVNMLAYSIIKEYDAPVITNYIFNLICLLFILYYYLFPAKVSNNEEDRTRLLSETPKSSRRTKEYLTGSGKEMG